MKTAKAVHPKPVPEECGVWLDTVLLKEKAKQKKTVRPISKMLNPLAKSGRYSLAAMVHFTQTKMEMPRTKQSSINSYFSPLIKPVATSNVKHGSDYSDVQEQNAEHEIQKDEREQIYQVGEEQQEMEPNIWSRVQEDQLDETGKNIHFRFLEDQADEMNLSQRSSALMTQTLTDFNLSEETFANHVFGKTSSQKPQLVDPRDDDLKENVVFNWSSPLKKRARHDDESLAQMFTQDSDGFHVIAHRNRRSPFKKHGDLAAMEPSKTLFEVQEALFTRDSEGNMVIKH
ncbi:aurora kinase A- and ninein-interacting protein [Stigmatopora argus]